MRISSSRRSSPSAGASRSTSARSALLSATGGVRRREHRRDRVRRAHDRAPPVERQQVLLDRDAVELERLAQRAQRDRDRALLPGRAEHHHVRRHVVAEQRQRQLLGVEERRARASRPRSRRAPRPGRARARRRRRPSRPSGRRSSRSPRRSAPGRPSRGAARSPWRRRRGRAARRPRPRTGSARRRRRRCARPRTTGPAFWLEPGHVEALDATGRRASRPCRAPG